MVNATERAGKISLGEYDTVKNCTVAHHILYPTWVGQDDLEQIPSG